MDWLIWAAIAGGVFWWWMAKRRKERAAQELARAWRVADRQKLRAEPPAWTASSGARLRDPDRIEFERPLRRDTETHRFFPMGIVGESYRNNDGASRQSIIDLVRVGDSIALVPEPDNRHDRHAVKVMHPAGQIGYIAEGQNLRVLDLLERGRIHGCEVLAVKGYPGSKGVVLEIMEVIGRYKKRS